MLLISNLIHVIDKYSGHCQVKSIYFPSYILDSSNSLY